MKRYAKDFARHSPKRCSINVAFSQRQRGQGDQVRSYEQPESRLGSGDCDAVVNACAKQAFISERLASDAHANDGRRARRAVDGHDVRANGECRSELE
jgi:hypothetical protein